MTTEPNELDKVPEELVDLVDEHFPKGVAKERGNASVLLAFFLMWHRSQTNKTIQRIKDGLPEELDVEEPGYGLPDDPELAADQARNYTIRQVRELLDKEISG